MPNWNISPEAAALHADSLICDITLPWIPIAEPKAGVLERFIDAGNDFVSLTVATDTQTLADTVKYIAHIKRGLSQRGDVILVKEAADITAAKTHGKLAVALNFQGTGSLEGNVDMVSAYYDLGIRHMLLAYNQKNLAGGGCHDTTDEGLSTFGVNLISEMNRVGMIVDCTHISYKTSMEAMELSQSPCIFSHSNSREVYDHERNIRDEQAKLCASKGGVIALNGVGIMLSADGDASVEALLRHINHFANLVGPEHLGFGLDFVYYEEQLYKIVAANPKRFPKGYPPPPYRFFAPEDLPHLTEALLKQGYGELNIRGLLGENFLRVCRTVWK